jgi:uncharacterized protein (DUF885 family)
MSANTDMADSEVVSEIQRYTTDPEQALAYKVEDFELRGKAKPALGAKFDLGDFHDVALAQAPLPWYF